MTRPAASPSSSDNAPSDELAFEGSAMRRIDLYIPRSPPSLITMPPYFPSLPISSLQTSASPSFDAVLSGRLSPYKVVWKGGELLTWSKISVDVGPNNVVVGGGEVIYTGSEGSEPGVVEEDEGGDELEMMSKKFWPYEKW